MARTNHRQISELRKARPYKRRKHHLNEFEVKYIITNSHTDITL